MLRRGLLQGILDALEDDVRRLVFADWLDENGEPDRADFIRAQIQMASTAEDDPNHERLRKAHRGVALPPLQGVGKGGPRLGHIK